jgi:hypothetical protein
MKRVVWPYRRPQQTSISAEGWLLAVDEQTLPLPDALPHWDYQTPLRLRRTIDLDLDAISAATRLPDDARLHLAVVWSSSGAGLREPATTLPVGTSGRHTAQIEVDLPGERLGGTITLRTLLVVAEPGSVKDPLAPRRGGSVLWSDETRVRLQGDAPQFPIAIVDFTRTSFPDNAAWHVDLGQRLEAATMGTLLLYLNERSKAVVQAFKNAASPGKSDRLVLSAVYADVARIMIESALNNPDFDDSATFEDESLGRTLQNLVWSVFPGRTIADLRQLRDHSPNQLATQIQAAVGVFQEP